MKRFITFFLTLTFMLALQNAWAVPAKPGTTEFTQPSGYTLVITVNGDEFVHWSETTDGYTLLQDKNGYYVYAQKDAKGNLVVSQQVAHNPGDRNATENAFLNTIAPKLRFGKAQIEDAYQAWGGKKGMEKRGGFPTIGDNKLIMILANFSDTETQFSQSDFDNYMNQDNYDGTGSFRDYYLEVSYGQLDVTTVVTTWVTLPHTHDYYGPRGRWGEFARDAVVAASSQVDYSEFDNDNDGEVDGVAIIHQGRGQEATSDESDIWSHSSSIPYYLNYNGVSVSAYTTQPELGGYSSMASIGVMCHEFGHNLGAPDYYDTDYEENGEYDGNGNWDVMSGGSYNNGGRTPAHHNPYTKWKYYEWINPIEINSEQEVTMVNSAENSTDFYYYTTPSSDEFWLLENRQKIGFDSYVPGHGLLIYHADESHINYYDGSNLINVGSHQGLYPVCAFASGNPPEDYGNINSSSTPFPGNWDNTEFTDYSTPASISWSGSATGKPVTNVTEVDGVISFSFMADVFEVTFYVTDSETGGPVNGASVSVGNQAGETESDGSVVFSMPNGTFDYIVEEYGYADYTGSVTVSEDAVTENVSLVPQAVEYNATFVVLGDFFEAPVEGAAVEVDNATVYTDDEGVAVAPLTNGTHAYTVTKDGYEPYSATVMISNSNASRNITLVSITNEVTFNVTANGDVVEGADIDVAGIGIVTGADGTAIIELPDGTHEFVVEKDGFPTYTEEVVVSGEAVALSVSLTGASNVDKAQFSIYPNPSSGTFTVEADGEYRVTIYNTIGNSIYSKSTSGAEIVELEAASAGIYFVKVESNGAVYTKRIVLNK